MIELLAVPYLPGGRDLSGWDCWGLVSYVGAKYKGIPSEALPKFGNVDGTTDQNAFQDGYKQTKTKFTLCEPQDGAIACCYRMGILYHVGIVHENTIIHARRGRGTVQEPLSRFVKFLNDVRFYQYAG